jgi:hypothetical protein
MQLMTILAPVMFHVAGGAKKLREEIARRKCINKNTCHFKIVRT